MNVNDKKTTAKKTINWWQPQVGELEHQLIEEVLASNYLNEGLITEKFEAELARRLGVRHAVAVTSGTAALYLSLYALGIRQGDEVIVPDLTFIATANAVTMCGARVVLVDIDPDSLNMDPGAFEQAITPRTKAVIPVHVSGRGADMQAIMAIARSKEIAVVEDAAEALMSAHKGKLLGTHGRLGCFSFSANKTITTGQGGLVVTNDSDLHTRLKQLKDQGRASRGTGGDDLHPVVGFNFKLTNLQAAVGLGQLQLLDGRLKRIQEIYTVYKSELSGLTKIKIIGFNTEDGEIPQWVDVIAEDRDGLDAKLTESDIHCRRFWHPLHTQKPYLSSDGNFPNSSKLSKKALWLPSAFTHSDNDIKRVCEEIKAIEGHPVPARRIDRSG
ncbi:MAG: pyridoxal phosphate-dependent aminotransferase [Candidatus Melainabacteria bacterium]|nr:MAG: pyridoxal phosphate-dependent aminotransferase [Candidatus Melainabacteria bacterium]